MKNKKEAASIQQNNSSEYDLGASLFTKYVKKKASLQQTNSYQQFNINDVSVVGKQHPINSTIDSNIQYQQRPSQLKSSQIQFAQPNIQIMKNKGSSLAVTTQNRMDVSHIGANERPQKHSIESAEPVAARPL